jgi:hypothetical protein
MQVIDFATALAQTDDVKRHLLMGNGFSIALFPNRFSYVSLLDSVDSRLIPKQDSPTERLDVWPSADSGILLTCTQ